MKKFVLTLCSFLLLAAVALAETPGLPTFEWERDGEKHWQLDAADAVINEGSHTLDDDWNCTVCGANVLDWGDGVYEVTDYDEHGNILRNTTIEYGEKTYESIHVYTYHEEGMPLLDVEYINGILYGETVYTVNADGEHLPVTQTYWDEDGSTTVYEYDEHGNCIRGVLIDASGTVFHETISEFALNDDGWYYECKTTSRFDSGETFYEEHNQFGDIVRSYHTDADGTPWGDWTYEYEYEDGSKVLSRQYSFGVLTCETYYVDDVSVKEIEYMEDGTKIISEYSENGDISAVTTYAADDSVASVTVYEYVYDEEDTQLERRVYTDEVLAEEIIYLYDDEDNFIGYTETYYNPNGTRTVDEYNDEWTLVRTVLYAADGSVISEEEIEYDLYSY